MPRERRGELDIDPGEKVVSRAAPGPLVLANTNAHVPFILNLGEIRMDDAGRLLVLGGHGLAGSTANPPVVINEYANNDTWFDDVGDGPVKARVRLVDGSVIDADAAWVIVGPPDFVPGVANAVTMYDLMWDLAVRELPAPSGQMFRSAELADLLQQKKVWAATAGASLEGYAPSFAREIYPILSRALVVRRLHEPFDIDKRSYHLQLMDWGQLASQDINDPLLPG